MMRDNAMTTIIRHRRRRRRLQVRSYALMFFLTNFHDTLAIGGYSSSAAGCDVGHQGRPRKRRTARFVSLLLGSNFRKSIRSS